MSDMAGCWRDRNGNENNNSRVKSSDGQRGQEAGADGQSQPGKGNLIKGAPVMRTQ